MKYYRIAKIVNTYGIRGEVKVIAETDFPEQRFAQNNQLFILNDHQLVVTVSIEKARQHKGTYLLKFNEYDDINQVERFKNHWLAIDEEQQEDLENDTFYYHQIIGLDVVTEDDVYLGIVKDILSLGSNDVWVVQSQEAQAKDILLPYIDDVIKKVDLNEKRIEVHLMEGLVDDAN